MGRAKCVRDRGDHVVITAVRQGFLEFSAAPFNMVLTIREGWRDPFERAWLQATAAGSAYLAVAVLWAVVAWR